MKTGLSVYDAMTKTPKIVTKDTTLVECAKVMEKNDVGSLVIVENKKVLGIVTEEDFVRRAISKNLDTKKTKVSDIMTKNIVKIEPDKDLSEAIEIMRKNDIRHLPVINNNELVGLVTAKDVLSVQPDLFDIYVEKLRMRNIEII